MIDVLTDDAHNSDDSSSPHSHSRKGRMRFSPEQIQALEQRFQEQQYLLPADRKILSLTLQMTERQIKTWFQNKRAQYKRSVQFTSPALYRPSVTAGSIVTTTGPMVPTLSSYYTAGQMVFRFPTFPIAPPSPFHHFTGPEQKHPFLIPSPLPPVVIGTPPRISMYTAPFSKDALAAPFPL